MTELRSSSSSLEYLERVLNVRLLGFEGGRIVHRSSHGGLEQSIVERSGLLRGQGVRLIVLVRVRPLLGLVWYARKLGFQIDRFVPLFDVAPGALGRRKLVIEFLACQVTVSVNRANAELGRMRLNVPQGVLNVIVPWTDRVDFFRIHGFVEHIGGRAAQCILLGQVRVVPWCA